ncbi:BlaI/MecI/CopY family transcriptional regulator [Actinocatenispora thailandica]|nr:BlaI/MecI/CopY family transcriptional regulator [Actinocatenispora thailandica]
MGTDDGADRVGLTRRVWQVLSASTEPMTTAQVRTVLGGGWAYTTVMTVLTRLVAQGAATRHRVGRAFAYTAVADEAELTARRMSRLLDAGTDRAAVLARFIDVLSDQDEKLLEELLASPRDDEDGS